MRSRAVLSLCLLASCRSLLGIEEAAPLDDAPQPPGDGAPLAECTAQRMVHVVAGNGGFAWFSLVWPAPRVITQFVPSFAYDDPAAAKNVTTQAAHTLFARKLVGGRAVWEGTGADPQPSVFIAGTNETHTATPGSIARVMGTSLDAAVAALQVTALPTTYPVLMIGNIDFGTAPGAPLPVGVNTVETGVTVLADSKAGVAEQLRPSAAQLALYVAPGASIAETEFATRLAFTANAMKLGLVTTVIFQAFNDDPHGAFAAGIVTNRANSLALALDAFYTDLDATKERACGHNNQPLSLADNVVMVVTGDTPKNSFANVDWPDGTPGLANWMYVRSNGFTIPGWFGDIDPVPTRTNWDPLTGQLGPVPQASSTAAAWAGTVYAIARGRRAAVEQFTGSSYDGVILR